VSRRRYARRYESLLPEFFPLKLIGAFISLDFLVGCSFACRFCISRRNAARQALFDAGLALENRISPRKMLAWLRTMPSFRAGVQIRIGHDTDAGLEFEKSAELIQGLPPDRSVTYLSRRPLDAEARSFFGVARKNLLLKLTATPRSESLGVRVDPLQLVRSVEGIDPEMTYWVVGPLVADNVPDAERVLDALPPGSHLFLKRLNTEGLPQLASIAPLSDPELKRLESRAIARGHVVTEWFCRRGLARVGQGFFDVDKITRQVEGEKRDRELAVCKTCPSDLLCHGELDWSQAQQRLRNEVVALGLTLVEEPRRSGPRSVELHVAEPSSRGDETYLSHAVGQPLSVRVTTREEGKSEGGSFCNVEPAALRRWYETGFLPVTELNTAAQNTLASIRQLLTPTRMPALTDVVEEASTC
jgi:hypothetical protein